MIYKNITSYFHEKFSILWSLEFPHAEKKNVISTIFRHDQGLKYYFCHVDVAKKAICFKFCKLLNKKSKRLWIKVTDNGMYSKHICFILVLQQQFMIAYSSIKLHTPAISVQIPFEFFITYFRKNIIYDSNKVVQKYVCSFQTLPSYTLLYYIIFQHANIEDRGYCRYKTIKLFKTIRACISFSICTLAICNIQKKVWGHFDKFSPLKENLQMVG